MALFRVDVVLPFFTGLPRDVISNTFHFESTGDTESVAVNAGTIWLKDFYETIYGTSATDRVGYINWPLAKVRAFNMEDPTPRIPWEERLGLFTAATGPSRLPTEVACVASWQSQGLPGERYQRRYNRIFLGGLMDASMALSGTGGFATFAGAFRTDVVTAMSDLQAAVNGPENLWVQVSKAGGSARSLPVIGGWCDDSPDTQRRRSVDAVSRTTWVAA